MHCKSMSVMETSELIRAIQLLYFILLETRLTTALILMYTFLYLKYENGLKHPKNVQT